MPVIPSKIRERNAKKPDILTIAYVLIIIMKVLIPNPKYFAYEVQWPLTIATFPRSEVTRITVLRNRYDGIYLFTDFY